MLDRLSNGSHVILIETQVMQRIKLRAKDFIAFVQMMQISPGEILAGVTVTVPIDGLGTVTVASIP